LCNWLAASEANGCFTSVAGIANGIAASQTHEHRTDFVCDLKLQTKIAAMPRCSSERSPLQADPIGIELFVIKPSTVPSLSAKFGELPIQCIVEF
jgi:hypothetical protein